MQLEVCRSLALQIVADGEGAQRVIEIEVRGAKTEAAANGFVKLFRPDAILTSPLVRAQQTAEIMKRASGLKRVMLEEALASGDDRALFAVLQKLQPTAESVLLVGHQPLLSHTLSNLVAGDPYSMQSTEWRACEGCCW